MAKQKKGKAFWIGLFLGVIIAIGAVYYYQNYINKSKVERKANRIEKKAKKEIKKAEDKAKDFLSN